MSKYAKTVKLVEFMSWTKEQRQRFVSEEMKDAPRFVKEALMAA